MTWNCWRCCPQTIFWDSGESLSDGWMFHCFKVLQLRPYLVWPLTVFFRVFWWCTVAGFTQKYPWAPASWIGIWHQQHKQKTPSPAVSWEVVQNSLILSLSVSHKYMTRHKHRDDDVSKTYEAVFPLTNEWSHAIWTMAATRKPETSDLACLATRAVRAFCRRVLLNCFSTWCPSG